MNPQTPPLGAQNATPFLAMILGELLELRAVTDVHDLFLRDLLEKASGDPEAEVLEYQQIALKTARRKVYKNVEDTMKAIFPNHLQMVQTLFRDVS
jgi:hypothetical protein